jgi:hypothetical protein
MKASKFAALGFLGSVLLISGSAFAQSASGECTGGLCGTPNQSGGGCSCSCGCSILVANSDIGDTWQYSDDYDNDGYEDDFDNCAFVPNLDQADADGDAIGDSCDNCAFAFNPAQGDVDADFLGDTCDTDADGDNVLNTVDNCMLVPNTSQGDNDIDGSGDACDADDDEDGIEDVADNCPLIANPTQDPASVVPGCDQDVDNDGVNDSLDNCVEIANPDQSNVDAAAGDLTGDACDSDADGDGIENPSDNCSLIANLDQADSDRDGAGNNCDAAFCYVVDNPGACLDPTATFTVYASAVRDRAIVYTADTGDELYMSMHANRGPTTAITYTWVIVERPDGSHATIENGSGSTADADPGTFYQYNYDLNRPVLFTPDRAGTYRLRLVADLAFPDTLYPVSHSESDVTVEVDGPALGACSVGTVGAAGGSATGLLVLLAGVALVVVRRRARR